MKKLFLFLFILNTFLAAQSNFSLDAYADFLSSNQNMNYEDIQSSFPIQTYYKGMENPVDLSDYAYLDSIEIKLGLTDDEKAKLRQNQFVVTERLNYYNFAYAFHHVYVSDLPVFVSADAILQTVHKSYDNILVALEKSIMKENLREFLDSMYDTFPQLVTSYSSSDSLQNALKDVDLYVTIAKSLLDGEKGSAQYADQSTIDDMWDAIQAEQYIELPLFSQRNRRLDLSQFTVRGHYDNDALRDYFKAMMWLGRMDFFLTPPPENDWEPPWEYYEIKRMNLSAFVLNELIELTENRAALEENDTFIRFLVGESDNLTPQEYAVVIDELDIEDATALVNDSTFDVYYEALSNAQGAEQKILSQILLMNPFTSEPGVLPISFRLMGQRFIIDSYVLANVVYDNIIYEGQKIWRPMPDPLDALFVLGNDDVLPILESEIEKYKYASQINALRYLVDSYDEDFWQLSLYNCWLNSIRLLNPAPANDELPVFLQTAAWRQEKMNTQLASWTQLRHDNLLYAKQSYTGGTGCSFPHSFVEPVPEFYQSLADFAEKAETFFSAYSEQGGLMDSVNVFFPKMKDIMNILQSLAQKEVNGQPFSPEDNDWMQTMLLQTGASGEPPFDGWYADLHFDDFSVETNDFIIADVHTQPTDAIGNMVGNVLHVATGRPNLGIFLAETQDGLHQPIAYVGPVESYYEKETSDFKRLTDNEWKETVYAGSEPERPDWVNIYLTDVDGNSFEEGRELPAVQYSAIKSPAGQNIYTYHLAQNYPNPFNPQTQISYALEKPGFVSLDIYNVLGKRITTLVSEEQPAGVHQVVFNAKHLSSGIYFYRIHTQEFTVVKKMMLVR